MCRTGDIYLAKLDDDDEGSLQSGTRPVLVVSNNKANRFSPVITIVPLTGNTGKRKQPTHVIISGCGLAGPNTALAEQITALNQTRLLKKIGSIRETVYERQIKEAIRVQLSM